MQEFIVREAAMPDLDAILELYTHFSKSHPIPEKSENLLELWQRLLNTRGHHIIVCTHDEKIVSSCVLTIIENLTYSCRPYSLVENVVTLPAYRKMGCGTAVLNKAKEIAEQNNCYKIMLCTGSKYESVLNFYKRAGYNSEEKTAFIQRI